MVLLPKGDRMKSIAFTILLSVFTFAQSSIPCLIVKQNKGHRIRNTFLFGAPGLIRNITDGDQSWYFSESRRSPQQRQAIDARAATFPEFGRITPEGYPDWWYQ